MDQTSGLKVLGQVFARSGVTPLVFAFYLKQQPKT
jgi:hypothetical protein